MRKWVGLTLSCLGLLLLMLGTLLGADEGWITGYEVVALVVGIGLVIVMDA